MSSTATRRVSAALATLAVSALLVLPARPAVATPAPVATRSQASPASNATAPSVFAQSWRLLADLLGWPTGATPDSAARRRGLTSLHSNLGGFIDPDGARTQSQTQGTLVVTP